MRVYGLTGGIGSGKSEAARRFESRGIPVIDADRIGHELIAPGGAAAPAVIEAFGDGIVRDGRIDRGALGRIVFDDAAALARLNAIVHPLLFAEVARRCALEAEAGKMTTIVDAALLGEGAVLEPWLAGLILVLCPVEERVRRLVASRGMEEAHVRQRIAAQTPPESKAPLARWLVRNDGTLEQLHTQVDAIAEELSHAG